RPQSARDRAPAPVGDEDDQKRASRLDGGGHLSAYRIPVAASTRRGKPVQGPEKLLFGRAVVPEQGARGGPQDITGGLPFRKKPLQGGDRFAGARLPAACRHARGRVDDHAQVNRGAVPVELGT